MKSKEFVVAGAALTLVAYVLALSLVGQVLSAVQPSKTVPNAGTVNTSGVGVYQESDCINALKIINWTILEPGSSKNSTCYVRNELSSVSTLSMSTSRWEPANASNFLTLSWDYGGQALNPDEVVQVTFTLSVDPSIQGITSFSFFITIVANS